MLSVCLVNWNTREDLAECLASLERACEGLEAEVIVVDNASADGSAEMVRERFPWARLIANQENLGYARGNNQAIEASTGDLVLLLNPDTVMPPDGLRQLAAFAEEHPQAGAIGCRLVYPDGRVQQSCRAFPTPDIIVYEYLGLSRLFPRSRVFGKYRMSWWDYGDVREVDQPMGSCLLLRREALEQVGLMDEQFPIFFNEVDLCFRLKQAGWRILYTPEPSVVHKVGRSTRQVRLQMIIESHDSLLRFYRKHYASTLRPHALWGVTALVQTGKWARVVRTKIASGPTCRIAGG
jgi:GT2 family glycosyltransferase